MTIKELEIKIEEIDKLVNNKIVSDDPDTKPITDGIIDVDKYYNSKHKILWILKEPYDDFDDEGKPFGGGWSLTEVIRSKKNIQEFESAKRTFAPMIYTSWGILNDFCLWDDMDYVENDPNMLDSLKSIAYINVKKLPGNKTSYHSVIEEGYQQNKEILLKQIDYYKPDIIIGGSTLNYFLEDLGINKSEMLQNKSINYIIKDSRIFIDAYHPGQMSITAENYCNDIIETVKIWAKNS